MTLFSPKLRRILRSAIDVGEEIFKKSGMVAELACNVADNLATYPELHSNLKQVILNQIKNYFSHSLF